MLILKGVYKMILNKITIQNFRLLKNFEIDLQNNLSLVVGKNNCGKTSLLAILEKMLANESKHFAWNDFSLETQQSFYDQQIGNDLPISDNDSIQMRLFIKYDIDDSYTNLHNFMMDLDPDSNIVILEFNYICTEEALKLLKSDLEKNGIRKINDFDKFSKYMNKNSKEYFCLKKYSCGYNNDKDEITDDRSKELKDSDIRKLIAFRSIKANREASNKTNDHSLSSLSAQYYKLTKEENTLELDELQNVIRETDEKLNDVYNGTSENKGVFHDIVSSIKRFGGYPDETKVTIQSSIEDKDLLKDNTILYYEHKGKRLPETYNGLGYLNLIGMIFEIETIIAEFKKNNEGVPSDINLLFIEEPEAHTHPQLQYIFIKNIKKLIEEKKEAMSIQTIITTHSSHIVADSDFDDMKYLTRETSGIVSKNFKKLKEDYEKDELAFKFVKQYLTLHRSELFFADKAIFIEGDTERILIPMMIKKIESSSLPDLSLLSQNISIIEAGAHAYTFKPLIDFLGIKTLIITDIDGVKDETILNGKGNKQIVKKACCSDEAEYTSNMTLKSLFTDLPNDKSQFKTLINKKSVDKAINNIRVAYQTTENNYQARSFEDAFIALNFHFVDINKDKFTHGIKNRKFFEKAPDYYKIAEQCIDKKSAFATEILYYDGTDGEYWEVPHYIKEGLEWLRDQ